MNFPWLRDKRLQVVAKTLPTVLSPIVLFASLVNMFGYATTALIAVIGTVIVWIFVSQAVERATPSSVSPTSPTAATKTFASAASTKRASPNQATTTSKPQQQTLHQVCDVGPYKVEAGQCFSVLLNVKPSQRVRGHLEEIDGYPFDWYIADEKNMVLLKNGERDDFTCIDEGYEERVYRVNRKIPYPDRWYLILDAYGKQYGRKIRVDFEPIAILSA